MSTFTKPDTRIISIDSTPEGKVAVSLESTNGQDVPLLEVYESSESGELKKVESEGIEKINSTGSYELANVDKADERVLLYTVKHLRKRGEH